MTLGTPMTRIDFGMTNGEFVTVHTTDQAAKAALAELKTGNARFLTFGDTQPEVRAKHVSTVSKSAYRDHADVVIELHEVDGQLVLFSKLDDAGCGWLLPADRGAENFTPSYPNEPAPTFGWDAYNWLREGIGAEGYCQRFDAAALSADTRLASYRGQYSRDLQVRRDPEPSDRAKRYLGSDWTEDVPF